LTSEILDFTFREFKYLYILYSDRIVVLNIEVLLQKNYMDDQGSQVELSNSIALLKPPSLADTKGTLFNCIETANLE